MATKFAPDAMPDETGIMAERSDMMRDRYTFGHATLRFLGAAMPAVTLGLALAYAMS